MVTAISSAVSCGAVELATLGPRTSVPESRARPQRRKAAIASLALPTAEEEPNGPASCPSFSTPALSMVPWHSQGKGSSTGTMSITRRLPRSVVLR
jgi:hypothetical protein